MLRRTFSSFVKSSAALFAVVAVGLVLAACSENKPSSPTQPQTPIGGSPAASYNVTITAAPSPSNGPGGRTNPVPANGLDSLTVSVTVSNAATGAPPVAGSTIVLETDLGFWEGTAATAIAVELRDGKASARLVSNDDGTGTVRAEFSGVFGHVGVRFGDATVYISSIDPNVGDPNGGDEVRIRGGGFNPPVTVSFGGNSAQVLSVNPNVVRVLSPRSSSVGSNTSVTVDITLVSDFGTNQTSTVVWNGGFTYSSFGTGDFPVINSVDPSSGPNEGGTTVTILGQNFENPVEVAFGNTTLVEATLVSFSPTRLVVVSPPATGLGAGNENSTVDVRVKNINSGKEATKDSAFTYGPPLSVTAIQPPSGSPFGGQTVSIFGSGFSEPLFVDIAGVRATVISVTSTEIVATTGEASSTGCADVAGEVVVTSTGSGLTSSGGPTYTYMVSQSGPVLTGIVPTNGSSAGGTTTTISGTGLDRPIIVLFDDIQGTVQSQTPTSAKVRTPGFPDSSLSTTTCDDNMDMLFGERYLPTSVSVTVQDTGTGCESTISGLYTYNPFNGACRND